MGPNRQRPSGLTRRELLGAGLGLGMVAACGPLGQTAPSPQTSGPRGSTGSITVGTTAEVSTLDATVGNASQNHNAFKNVFDQLVTMDRNAKLVPHLAESWTTTDAVRWTLKIRAGHSFHNGQPVTVDDVVWSFEKVAFDEKNPIRPNRAQDITSIKKVDDRTIEFVLTRPNAVFLSNISFISIVPRADFQARGAQQFALAPVGSGPYRVVEWVKDDHLTMEAIGKHYNGTPAIKTVNLRPIVSPSSRVAGLESGELDIVEGLPPPEVERLRRTPGLRVETVASNRNIFLGINATVKPLDDVKVRHAIDLSIDRQRITKELLGGLGKPTGWPAAPSVFGFDSSAPVSTYDPERAKALLRESRYAGEVIDFQYPSDIYQYGTEVSQALAGYLDQVGLKVKLQGMTFNALFAIYVAKALAGLYLFAAVPSSMDMDTNFIYYESTGRGYWSSPEVDSLIQKQRITVNEQERLKVIGEAIRLAHQSYPMAWLYTDITAYGVRDRVDWKPRADGQFRMTEATLKS